MIDQTRTRQGFSIIEVLVGASIISFVLVGMIAAFGNFLRLGDQSVRLAQATFLLEETAEVLRLLRDDDWDNISTLSLNSDHFLDFNGSSWSVTDQNVYVDGAFERKFQLSAVNRDGSDDISPTGTNDPDTRLVTTSVSWKRGSATTTRQISFYLTNMFNT